MKYSFHKDLHIATVESESDWHTLRVNTLLQNTEAKQPSINAFLGARYSRSADSMLDISKEIYESGKDASKRLEAIFYNYGHKSVGDMADLFLCLENIPMFDAERFFYLNPVHSGQGRSTRFQDFSKPQYIKIPKSLKVTKELRQGYEDIILLALKYYLELKGPVTEKYIEYFKIDKDNTQENGALMARVFDTIRYFLPIGLQTSIGVLMSARAWAERISYYRASKFSTEREIGEMIYLLLSGTKELQDLGYMPEADTLIRHVEADLSRNDSAKENMEIIKKMKLQSKEAEQKYMEFDISTKNDAVEQLIRNYMLMLEPYKKYDYSKKELLNIQREIAPVISKYHNHHHQMGNVAQSGSILIEGVTDYGVLKDLIRHRSFEKFIPLLEENFDISIDLDRETPFGMCNYLEIPEMKKLKDEYQKDMKDLYSKIRVWNKLAKKELSKEMANEYTRYLLPHGHATKYKFYASVDDLAYTIALRSRNGGHIAYRKLTYDWLVVLAKKNPFWNGLLSKLPEVKIDSREQFVDRS